MNEQIKLSICFDEEIKNMIHKKELNVEPLILCKNDIQRVILDIKNLPRIDIERLQNSLNLDIEIIEKFRFYSFLLICRYHQMTSDQEQEILSLFTHYLEMIEKKIEQEIANHPETPKINEMIDILQKCNGMLIDEDFDLDDYTKIFIKLKPYQEELPGLCDMLSNYMINQLLEKNNISKINNYFDNR